MKMDLWFYRLKVISFGYTKAGGETHGISKGDDIRHQHIRTDGAERRRKDGIAAGDSDNWQQGGTG